MQYITKRNILIIYKLHIYMLQNKLGENENI